MMTISASQQVLDEQFLVARRTFQLLGMLALLTFPVMLFFENAELMREIPFAPQGRAFVAYAVVDGVLVVCGVGLFWPRRWAAAVFSGFTLLWAGDVAVQLTHQIRHLQDAASVIGLGYVVLLAVPAMLTVKNWRAPIWR